MLYDAHNHLQDTRLLPWRAEILATLPALGIGEVVVNGSAEDDWEEVATLARAHNWIRPAFGLHPWYVRERTPAWLDRLRELLIAFPDAVVGEIGIDRWIENPDLPAQQECFQAQMHLADELNRPAAIHCLRAWGLLGEMLRTVPVTARGFLLHSYGGPAEMIPGFVKQGAYFSLSPYFGHPRKTAQLAVFRAVPPDHLLAETDAPDMWPPDDLNPHPLLHEGQALNHPANLTVSYDLLAQVRGLDRWEVEELIAKNYRTLFGE